MLERWHHAAVAADLAELPSSVRIEALARILLLRLDPFAHSQQLEDLPGLPLAGWRKHYFGGNPPAYRIVFRLEPDEQRPTRLAVVAVGPRERLVAYRRASARARR